MRRKPHSRVRQPPPSSSAPDILSFDEDELPDDWCEILATYDPGKDDNDNSPMNRMWKRSQLMLTETTAQTPHHHPNVAQKVPRKVFPPRMPKEGAEEGEEHSRVLPPPPACVTQPGPGVGKGGTRRQDVMATISRKRAYSDYDKPPQMGNEPIDKLLWKQRKFLAQLHGGDSTRAALKAAKQVLDKGNKMSKAHKRKPKSPRNKLQLWSKATLKNPVPREPKCQQKLLTVLIRERPPVPVNPLED